MPRIRSETVQDWLQGVTHRPGWTIASAGEVDGGAFITILVTEPDTNNPAGGEFQICPLWRVPDEVHTRDQFYDWILDICIPGIDTHERWEWFRVGGEKWRDPHAQGMPAFAVDF